ncbi:amme chromosomal region 1-like protein [Moniliophthora roreri MCA 2997]|uniref:Amme chromosomal region 1-like protein n=2 Tax=Moniliophthora roreri TaxID=221103 RepID=V2XJ42_MONRO|nr:amme chromosomal region 1-like protein [Moniliophthora roreri MCA 2997]KAI3596691.1 amme chromosomal region 1-like protein [Moniliophthora roreri]
MSTKNEDCLPEHCFHAFDALYCSLIPSATPIDPTFSDDEYPLFVTWNKLSSRGNAKRLRGCIGSFDPLSLHTGLPEYALISAFRDNRFRPIQQSEFESLECAVSLLINFEDAQSYLDWEIGKHGIYISFPHPSTINSSAPSPLSSQSLLSLPSLGRKKQLTATYLPDVMPEQGWDKQEAIDSAIQKAGWNGLITEDIRRSVKLRRYQSSQYSVTWAEYLEWRQRREAEIEDNV